MPNSDSGKDEPPKHLHLSDKQKEFLKQEYSPNSPGKWMKDILNKKVKYLPERIERLFSDIELLAEAGFFDPGWNTETFDRVQLDNDWIQLYCWDEFLYASFPGYNEELTESQKAIIASFLNHNGDIEKLVKAQKFGSTLGSSIHYITNESMTGKEKEYLAFGFIRELLLEESDGDVDKNYEQLKRNMDDIDELLEEWHFITTFNNNIRSSSKNYADEKVRMVNELIHDAGLTASNVLRKEIFDMAYDNENHIIQINPFEHGWVLNETDAFTEEDISIDDYREQMRDDISRSIEDIKQNSTISDMELLIDVLEHVLLFLHNLDDAWEMFKIVYLKSYNNKNNILFTKPGEFFDEAEGDKMSEIRTLANEKGVSTEGQQGFIKFPVITEDSYTSDWKITPLGELIGYILITMDAPQLANEMAHGYALNSVISVEEQGLVERAFEQIKSR